MENPFIFNPLDKRNLGKSIVDALLESSEFAFSSLDSFPGAGIYAVYYKGDFPLYSALASLNKSSGSYPIYVGKAIPKGGRKGIDTDSSLDSNSLFKRLLDHRKSLESSSNLRLVDFSYRCLVLDDIWISLGEALVIQKYQPLWNKVIDGFGNHDPGAGRYGGMRPFWYEIHPGRSWAEKCKPPKVQRAQIELLARNYMNSVLAAEL